jgi:hypothetical protein
MEDPMTKIENEAQKQPEQPRRYEVLISFDGLNKGDVFEDHDDHRWAERHVTNGYLRRVDGEEPGHERSEIGQG